METPMQAETSTHTEHPAQTEAPAQYDWLAMLFLGGDNDLFRFGDNLLEEAKRVGSTSRVAVVAERDPTERGAVTQRGQIFPGGWEETPIGVTSGDAESIVDFIDYAKREFPAKERLLVLWDHGNGWQNVHAFHSVVAAAEPLRLLDIGHLMNRQQGISVLCFDSCLMAMIEIAYQLLGKVEFIIASENVVPADSGWPYDSILRMLTSRPETSPEEVVSAIVNNFAGAYNNSDQPVALSALRVAKATDTVAAIDALARELIAGCTNEGVCQKIFFARRYSQSFGNPDYIDLVSFCDELQKQLPETEIDKAAAGVKVQVGEMVVAATRGTAPSVSRAHGLSIYFPDRPMSLLYEMLDFSRTKTCLWAAFLAMMTPKIAEPQPILLRKPRPRRKRPAGAGGGGGARANKPAPATPSSPKPDAPVTVTSVVLIDKKATTLKSTRR